MEDTFLIYSAIFLQFKPFSTFFYKKFPLLIRENILMYVIIRFQLKRQHYRKKCLTINTQSLIFFYSLIDTNVIQSFIFINMYSSFR